MKNDIPILKIIAALVFIALFAQISFDIPTNDGGIPISGQTFAVLLVGYILHRKWGTVTLILYMLLGGLGLPIFADGNAGWEIITGNSGGFLIGFIAGAYLTGYFGELGWDKSFPKSLLAMTLGTAVIMFFGVLWLAQIFDFERALEYGFYPFLIGAVVKIILGAVVMPVYYKFKTKNK